MQKPLAWLISSLRQGKTKKAYSLIGGKSPILTITMAQADELEKESGLKVYVGMRYWRPSIEDVLARINHDGIKRLIVLSLYPHYSKATTGSAIRDFKGAVRKYPISYHTVTSWFDQPSYIEALADVIKKGIASFWGDATPHLLFSAHSLPRKFIDEGDPYVNEIMKTINEVMKRMEDMTGRQTPSWHLSYQSKSGPVTWLTPSTDEMLRRLSAEAVRKVLVIPISFVSDHIETLYEIDILYKGIAERLGIELKRTESLNTHPIFIRSLKEIILDAIKKAGWEKC